MNFDKDLLKTAKVAEFTENGVIEEAEIREIKEHAVEDAKAQEVAVEEKAQEVVVEEKATEALEEEAEKPEEKPYDKESFKELVKKSIFWHGLLGFAATEDNKEAIKAEIQEVLEVRLEVLKDISKELLEYENIFIDKVAEDEKALEGGLERTPEEEKAYEEERGEDLKTLLKLQMDELNAAALFAITGSYLVSLDNEADELDEEILNDSLRRKDLCLHKKLSWHLDNLDDSVYSFKENLAADVHALLLKLDFSYRVVDALDDRFEANMANFPLKTELKDIELEKEFLTEVTDYEDIDVVEFAEEAYVFIAGKNTRTGEVYKQEDSTEKFNGKVMDVTHLYSSPRLLHFLRWVNVKVEEAPQQEE